MTQCEIEFINRGTSLFQRSTPEHVHHFWQIEIGVFGVIEAVIDGRTEILAPDAVFLIPPDTRHSFRYTGDQVKWLSLKYHYPLPEDSSTGGFRIIESGPYLDDLRDLVIRSAYDVTLTEERCRNLLTGLLSVFMEYYFIKNSIEGSPFVSKVHSILRTAEGRRLDIKSIAAQMHYSVGHVANMYRKETGMSLKKKIDRERIKTAEGLIRHTTMNVGEIARQLEFTNIYAFSRFVRTHTGRSPLQLRREYHSRTGAGDGL